MEDKLALICGYSIDKVVEIVNEYKHNRLVPADFILDRAELCDKEWEEDRNHYCRNVADGLRDLLQSWEDENG